VFEHETEETSNRIAQESHGAIRLVIASENRNGWGVLIAVMGMYPWGITNLFQVHPFSPFHSVRPIERRDLLRTRFGSYLIAAGLE